MQEMTLKKRLKEALSIPESDFSNHCSDLYLIYTPEREKWLKQNYEYWKNVRICFSNIKGQDWYGKRFFDIPFAFTEDYQGKIVH